MCWQEGVPLKITMENVIRIKITTFGTKFTIALISTIVDNVLKTIVTLTGTVLISKILGKFNVQITCNHRDYFKSQFMRWGR